MSYTWKVSPSHPKYEVSSKGAVRNIATGKIKRIYLNSGGYPQVCIDSTTISCHVLVAEAFIGHRPEGLEVDHIDENKINNDFRNLRYVTKSFNNRKNGRRPGFSQEVLHHMEELLISGTSQHDIANIFGCSQQLISYHFKHLKLPKKQVSPEAAAAGKAKLTKQEIITVRALKGKYPSRTVGPMFDVSYGIIHRIWNSDKFLCKEGYYV